MSIELRRGPSWGRQAPGECRLSWGEDGLVIERADPHVWLDDEFLRRLVSFAGRKHPWVTLTYQLDDVCQPQQCCQRFLASSNATSSVVGYHCYFGSRLQIDAVNGVVAYRIGRFLRDGIWEAKFA